MTSSEIERHRMRGEGGEQKFCKVSHAVKFMGKKISNDEIEADITFNESDGCWGEKGEIGGEGGGGDIASKVAEYNNGFSFTLTR